MIRTELKYNQLGVGSLVLPEDVDRTDYINRVYTLGQAAIHVPDIGIIQVALGVNILDYIEFPETSESFGSLISYYKMPVYNRYVAFAVLKKINDDSILNEYSFRLGKRKAGSVVEVIGNANSSDLFVNVSSNESGKGKLTINIVNNDDTADRKSVV